MRKGQQRDSGSVSDPMTRQELATSSKSLGVQGLLPDSRPPGIDQTSQYKRD